MNTIPCVYLLVQEYLSLYGTISIRTMASIVPNPLDQYSYSSVLVCFWEKNSTFKRCTNLKRARTNIFTDTHYDAGRRGMSNNTKKYKVTQHRGLVELEVPSIHRNETIKK